MASPQKENGYTPIANEIMDAVAKLTLSPTGYKILFVVWRQTYGFNRCQWGLSDTFIAKATGVSAPHINREINNLIKKEILTVYKPGNRTEPRIIGFNKNYEKWQETGTTNLGTTQTGSTTKSHVKGTTKSHVKVLPELVVKERHLKTIKRKTNIYSPKSQEYILSDYLLQRIKQNNPGHKNPNLNTWAKHIDLMIRRDNRDPVEIRAVIDFCQADTFWKANILSTDKLRAKYDQLNIKRKEVEKSGGTGTIPGRYKKPIYREEDRENPDAWRTKRTP